MFCKWCGKKIANIGIPCPSCGKSQDSLENGNGFWDLCSKEIDDHSPEYNAAIAVSNSNTETPNLSQKEKVLPETEEKTRSKKNMNHLLIAIIGFIVIAIIVIGLGLRKLNLCITEMSYIRSDISNVISVVNDGFNAIETFHNSNRTPDNVVIENGMDNTALLNISELLKDEESILCDSKSLEIKCYEIGAAPVRYVYLAEGEALELEDVKIFWQQSSDYGNTWETICEDDDNIVVEANKSAIYRIICITEDASGEHTTYMAATVDILSYFEECTEGNETHSTEAIVETTYETEITSTNPTESILEEENDPIFEENGDGNVG